MQLTNLLFLGTQLLGSTSGLNMVLSNDDGWAEINIRVFYNALTKAGNSVVLSAPAVDRSGTGSWDAPATPLIQAGEFNSIPAGSPAEGFNKSQPRLNYVNSFPVTSMRYGITTLAPKFFKKSPINIAVAGPNVGNNAGPTVLLSGTVGATTEAAKEGYPAIAFSGESGSQTAWNITPVPHYAKVYGELSARITGTLTHSGISGRYMPAGTFVNVNFPAANTTTCANAAAKGGDFKFVFSRIMDASKTSGADVKTCGNGGRLPTEQTVLDHAGCYVSISVGNANTKMDVGAAEQKYVMQRLSSILSCLPK